MDFWGPYRTAGRQGEYYILTITDDYSRKVWVFPTKVRSDAGTIFQEWQARAQIESGEKVMAICCDGAPELKALHSNIKGHGGTMEIAAAYTPEKNGVAERMNQTLIEHARTMLADTNLPRNLWPDIVRTAAYLRRNQTLAQGQKVTPEELWTGQRPDLSYLRVFGCDAYALIPKEHRSKLDDKSEKCILLGYGDTTVHYKLWNPCTKRVVVATDVEFNDRGLREVRGLPRVLSPGYPANLQRILNTLGIGGGQLAVQLREMPRQASAASSQYIESSQWKLVAQHAMLRGVATGRGEGGAR